MYDSFIETRKFYSLILIVFLKKIVFYNFSFRYCRYVTLKTWKRTSLRLPWRFQEQNSLDCLTHSWQDLLHRVQGIQQLRGPNFTHLPSSSGQFWTYYLPFVHVTKHALSTDHQPTFSCPRSYWMPPAILYFRDLCVKNH